MSNKHIAFIIYTYDRYQLILDLLNSIQRELPPRFKTKIFIFDDCSPNDQTFQKKDFSFPIHYHKFSINHGKKKWYVMIDYIYKFLQKRRRFDYYFFLNDDMEFIKNGINKAIKLFNSIEHPNKIALNLHNDRGPDSKWSYRSGKNYNQDLWKTGWTDTSFLCQEEFLKRLNWEVPKEKFFKIVRNQKCGSGMGYYISRTLSNQGKRFFLVKKSLIVHKGNEESKMNPKERLRHPLITQL